MLGIAADASSTEEVGQLEGVTLALKQLASARSAYQQSKQKADAIDKKVRELIQEHMVRYYRRCKLVWVSSNVTAHQLAQHLDDHGYAHVISCRICKSSAKGREDGSDEDEDRCVLLEGWVPATPQQKPVEAKDTCMALLELIPRSSKFEECFQAGLQWLNAKRDRNFKEAYRLGKDAELPVDRSIGPKGTLGVIPAKEPASKMKYIDNYIIGESGRPWGQPFEMTMFEFGSMVSERELVINWQYKGPVLFALRTTKMTWLFKQGVDLYRMEIRYRDVVDIMFISPGQDQPKYPPMLVMPLKRPPRVMCRKRGQDSTKNGLLTGPVDDNFWNVHRNEAWIRKCNDFTGSKRLGSSLVYRFALPDLFREPPLRTSDFAERVCSHYITHHMHQYALLRTPQQANILQNKVPHSLQRFELLPAKEMKMQEVLVKDLKGVHFMVKWWVEVCLSHGTFSTYQLTSEIHKLLQETPKDVAVAVLRNLYDRRKPVSDLPKEFLMLLAEWGTAPAELLEVKGPGDSNLVIVCRALVTPTRVIAFPPDVDTSNRVLHKYKDLTKRHAFLRVMFGEEDHGPLNKMEDNVDNSEAFARAREICKEGLVLAGRRYLFLASSASQYRTFGAWFYYQFEKSDLTADRIIGQLGNLHAIRPAAKAAMRLAQWLTTIIRTVDVTDEHAAKIDDVEDNGYNYSDGCGVVSHELAQELARELVSAGRLPHDVVPSAFQIRWRGCKGMVSVWERWAGKPLVGRRLLYRPSMNKFEANDSNVGVCSVSRYMAGYLNQDIITLLECNGVPNNVFMDLQAKQLEQLRSIGRSPNEALKLLRTYEGSMNIIYSRLAHMLAAGYNPREEPMLAACLGAITAWTAREMRNKTHIFVPEACRLLGVMDESGVLEYGQVFLQIQPHFGDQRTIINGPVLTTRNPCLHPGDIRKLTAVDRVELRHLVNVAVFPKKGPRPHANEASGGDYDGDDFFLCWHQPIVELFQLHDAMNPDQIRRDAELRRLDDAEALQARRQASGQLSTRPGTSSCSTLEQLLRSCAGEQGSSASALSRSSTGRPVALSLSSLERAAAHAAPDQSGALTRSDVYEQLIKHAENDLLGRICNAHRALADQAAEGARDSDCLILSWLASRAVDLPKTGDWDEDDTAVFDIIRHQRVRQWPDFMQKPYRSTYPSKKVLGELFRNPALRELVEESDMLRSKAVSDAHSCRVFDPDLVVDGWRSYVGAAQTALARYSHRMLGLMNQFREYHEGSLLTGLLLRPRDAVRRSDFDERLRCVELVTALQHEFLQDFMKEFEGQDQKDKWMRAKASAWYRVAYDPSVTQPPQRQGVAAAAAATDSPRTHILPQFIYSFGWIPHGVLLAIKTERMQERKAKSASNSQAAQQGHPPAGIVQEADSQQLPAAVGFTAEQRVGAYAPANLTHAALDSVVASIKPRRRRAVTANGS